MEANFMTAVNSGNLGKVPDSDNVTTDMQYNRTEINITHHVTKEEVAEMADDNIMSSSKTLESNEGMNVMNGEIEMSNPQTHTVQSEVTSQLDVHHAQLDGQDEVATTTNKPSNQWQFAQSENNERDLFETPKQSNSSVQGDVDMDESSMDVDDFSMSSKESQPLIRHVFLDGSETTDSRDSLSASGGIEIESAMDVDVVTSSSQDNFSKVSDDTDTIASLDSQQSNDSEVKPGSGMSIKRPRKPKTPWIPLKDLPYELDHGYRILRDLMGDKCKSYNWPFMDPVDVESLGLWDYHDRIKQPMWLRKIQFKFVDREYQSITEFVSDVRVLLENCYRYNGMKHWVSKQAQRLECSLQQKLTLLPRDLLEKTTLYATSKGKYGAEGASISTSSGRRRFSGRTTTGTADQSPLATSVRKDMEEMDRENKRQQIITRKEEIAQYYVDLIDWEKELMGQDGAQYMGFLWEIPFIGHFLFLCQTALCLEEVSYYELERAFAAPRESSLLRRIYTSLLSTPYQRARLEKKPTMPYKVWEAKLREYVRYWYSIIEDDGSMEEGCKLLGIPVQFFEVLGDRFMMDHKRYHELTFYERVWVMKALCDYLYETQSIIKKTVDAQPIQDQRQMVLGYDRDSNAYIHFPQFCGADLRIYRQAAFPEPEIKVKPKPEVIIKPEETKEVNKGDQTKSNKPPPPPEPVPPPRTRPSRLRKKINPVLRHGINSENDFKAAKEAEKDDEDKVNGEIKDEEEEEETSSETKDSVEKDNVDGDGKEDDTKSGAKSCATESTSANNDSSGISSNDNNSNNRNVVKESEISTVIPQDANENNEEISPDKKYIVPEQTEVTKVVSSSPKDDDDEGFAEEKVQSTSVDLDKKDVSTLSEGSSSEKNEDCKSENQNTVSDVSGSETKVCDSQEVRTATDATIPKQETPLPAPESGIKTEQSDEQVGESEQQVKTEAVTGEGITSDEQNKFDMGDFSYPKSSLLSSPTPPVEAPTLICWSPPRPSTPLPEREEVVPPVGEFELVCDSVEGLRALVKKFSGEPEEIIIPAKGKKKQKTIMSKPVRRKRCEIELYDRLAVMLFELEPWEGKLDKAATRTREKLNKEVIYHQPTDPDKVIKDVWASEEEVSSESESESSDSDTTSDSDSDSSDDNNMKTEDIKPAIASAAQAEITKKPEEPDSTIAIVDSVLEHEIPARRTRLARKRHIHMLKSAKKAAAKAAVAAANGKGSKDTSSSELPNKKPRVSTQQPKPTSQPVHVTLGNGPGSLSASLPMYSILKSSNVLNTGNITQPSVIRMPAAQMQVTGGLSIQNPTNKSGPAQLILQQPGVGTSQPTSLATGQNPTGAAAVLTKTAAGNNVRYISLTDLARINPALAQTISSMSAQSQQQKPAAASGSATKLASPPPTQGLGAVPGITCIMKSPNKPSTSQAQQGSNATVNQLASSTAAGAFPVVSNSGNVNTVTSVASSVTQPSQIGNVTVMPGVVGTGLQQVVKTNTVSNTASLGQTISGNAQTRMTLPTILSASKPVLQTVQLPQAGGQSHPASVPPPAYKAATQIVTANQPVAATLNSIAGTAQLGLSLPATPIASGTPVQVMSHASTSGTNATAVPSNSVVAPGGVPTTGVTPKTTYTITVDAKMWKQLQGKPQLQQQVILSHIRQKQLQQQLLVQQAAAQNKAITSPTKTSVQNQVLLQQQPVLQTKLPTSPMKTVIQANSQQQQLLQQPLIQQQQYQQQQQHVPTNPIKTVTQPIFQQQVLQQQVKPIQQPYQPAKQIIRMNPAQNPAVNQQLTAQQPTGGGTIQLTHTQQTQQQSMGVSQPGQVVSSPVRITIPIQQKPGGGPIQLTAAQSASIQQQLLRLQHPQQVQGGTLTLSSPTKGITTQQSSVLVNQNLANQGLAPSSTTPSVSIQAQPQQQQQRSISLTLSPPKQATSTQKLVGSPGKPNMVTVPLSALLNQQIKQVQQPGKPASFVYVLPSTSSVPTAVSQGSQGIVLQGARSLPQTGQGTQNVVMMQNAPSIPPVQRLVNLGNVNTPTLSQPSQGTQSAAVQNISLLTQPVQGQQQALSTQTRNIVQLLQQGRGQPNASILMSALHNQAANISQASTSGAATTLLPQATSAGMVGSQIVIPATQPINTGVLNPSMIPGGTTVGQHLVQQNLTTSLSGVQTNSGQSILSTALTSVVQPGAAATVPAQPAQGNTLNDTGVLSAQEKSAQQTFQ